MERARAQWLKGMCMVILVAIIWIAASYLVQEVESQGLPPFVLTYICNSLFIVLIPLVELSWLYARRPHLFSEGPLGLLRKAWGFSKLSKDSDTDALVGSPSLGSGLPPISEEASPLPAKASGLRAPEEAGAPSKSPSKGSPAEQSKPQARAAADVESGVAPVQRALLSRENSGGTERVASRLPSLRAWLSPSSPESDTSSCTSPDATEGVQSRLPSFRAWMSPISPDNSKGKQSATSSPDAAKGTQRGPRGGVPLNQSDPHSSGANQHPDTAAWREEEAGSGKGIWTRARIASVSLIICPFWFLAQLTFNVSLGLTSVSSNTILSSTASLFTLMLSVAFLGEKFTATKLVSVLLVIAGTAVVSISDSQQGPGVARSIRPPPPGTLGAPPPGVPAELDPGSDAALRGTDSLAGDLLCLCSAFFYAVYTSLLRKCAPDESEEEQGQLSEGEGTGGGGEGGHDVLVSPAMGDASASGTVARALMSDGRVHSAPLLKEHYEGALGSFRDVPILEKAAAPAPSGDATAGRKGAPGAVEILPVPASSGGLEQRDDSDGTRVLFFCEDLRPPSLPAPAAAAQPASEGLTQSTLDNEPDSLPPVSQSGGITDSAVSDDGGMSRIFQPASADLQGPDSDDVPLINGDEVSSSSYRRGPDAHLILRPGPDSPAQTHQASGIQLDASKLQGGGGGGGEAKAEAGRGHRVCGACFEPVQYSTALMFGYLGCFNMMLLLPALLLLPLNLHWPTLVQWGLVVLKGLMDNVLSDYLWARAVLLTTPTAATAGLQIQVPISIVVDSIISETLPPLQHLAGSSLIVLGFLGLNDLLHFGWVHRIFLRQPPAANEAYGGSSAPALLAHQEP